MLTYERKKTRTRLFIYLFWNWEVLTLLALTTALTCYLPPLWQGWPLWAWPLIGLVCLLLIVYIRLTDVAGFALYQLKLFHAKLSLASLHQPELRQQMSRVLDVQRRIVNHVYQQPDGLLRDQVERTASQLARWVEHLYALSLRLDRYQSDNWQQQDRLRVEADLKHLQQKLDQEQHPLMQQLFQGALTDKTHQWQTLQALEDQLEQAHIQLNQSVTSLATLYSQMQLMDAQKLVGGSHPRLLGEIQGQVDRLDDLVASIGEVYRT